MKDGFIRVAVATPRVRVADCAFNLQNIVALAREGTDRGAAVIVFPELCLTAYTCGDLFLQQTLIQAAEDTLAQFLKKTSHLQSLLIVGLPVHGNAALYNCAAVCCQGRLLGVVPKGYIPNYAEFYEARLFSPAGSQTEITLAGQRVPMGSLLFRCENYPSFCVGVEICEDLWVPVPPSCRLAQAGATVLCNLSASDEVAGKPDYRRRLVTAQAGHMLAAYLYANAGEGESSTDLVFSGHSLIAENGMLLSESPGYVTGLTYADIDVLRLQAERRRITTFLPGPPVPEVTFRLALPELTLEREISPLPFVPRGPALEERCEEILAMQTAGLATRLQHTGSKTVVLGVSGGLDSTLALLVAARALDRVGLPRTALLAVTMPGFGTTARTKGNARALASAFGATYQSIPIRRAVLRHFQDIGHDPAQRDTTYENAQARERTQVLMDLANKTGGLVLGTGDLSELALGWATYNGDHMSMYGVNSSIPKTLVRHLVAYEAARSGARLQAVLQDVLDTPVSPELLPPENGQISQKTEDLVGPYELHDFFLYYMMRFGFPPRKIYRLARHAFGEAYKSEEILHWMQVFYTRFFTHQFKRSCLPDGPKVGTVSLSPRGDFRMPSDAVSALWLEEIKALSKEE